MAEVADKILFYKNYQILAKWSGSLRSLFNIRRVKLLEELWITVNIFQFHALGPT